MVRISCCEGRMAYNLQPLIAILEQILDPQQTRWVVDDNKPQLQSLLEKSRSLKQIIGKSSLSDVERLESKIRDAAHKVEDIIESHMVYQILSSPGAVSFAFHIPDLHQVIVELDSVIKQLVKLTERSKELTTSFQRQRIMVGVDEDLMQLKERVLGMPSKLEIVPIIGMSGTGKTSLARILYEDPSVVEHFIYLAWVSVSQDYDMQAIFLSLLRCIIGKECDQHTGKESYELGEILHHSLYGRRYIIVLDDIWSSMFWDEIRRYLPDNNNGSRIVIITRLKNLAAYVSSSWHHEMRLLSEPDSWDLLRQIVFGEEKCPAVLERIGRNIAINCRGLPLAIQTIGGLLLSKANRTERLWENVANDVRATIAQHDYYDSFLTILSLSYNGLPSRLKSCLLYIGSFPEDYEIKASRLVRLWVAEGFLKSNGDKSLEEEAENCLKALVNRNLVSISAIKSDGRPKRYGMHDLMRDLCLMKAKELRFAHQGVGRMEEDSQYGPRRVFVQSSAIYGDINPPAEFMSLVRSFVCTGSASRLKLPNGFSRLLLLRVLDVFEMEFGDFPIEVLHMLNLRYLAFSYSDSSNGEIPSDITRLCNLQTLALCFGGDHITLPSEILQMAELRNVVVYGAPIRISSSDWSSSGFILQKLHTIHNVVASQEFLHKIPYVKKLGIVDELSTFDLRHLHKLETLRFSGKYNKTLVYPSKLGLPLSLTKMSLRNCRLTVDFINCLCELPNLEVLKLRGCEFDCGGNQQEWDATKQEFCKLKFLLLEGVELTKWEADETNFPQLRHLVIRSCSALEEIPSGIGKILRLQTIELDKNCRPSLVASAELIIKEQRDNGNDDLQLRF